MNNPNDPRYIPHVAALLHGLGPLLRPTYASVLDMLMDCWQGQSIARHLPIELDLLSASRPLIEQANQLAGAQPTPVDQQQLLAPVVNRIHLGEKAKADEVIAQAYRPQAMPLNLTDATFEEVFPFTTNVNTKASEAQSLRESLINEIERLGYVNHLSEAAYGLYHLLMTHTSRVPASVYPQYRDVSYFDHARTLAGIVNCLSHPDNPNQAEQFVLIKGDLSGIQKFIYSQIDLSEAGATEKTAKKLRGRSFYVSYLTDLVASRFLAQFQLNQANILYAGGGHFLMFAPAVSGWEAQIAQLTAKLNQSILQQIESRISFVVGAVPCGQDLFQNTSLYIKQVNDDLNVRKKRKHGGYLNHIFAPDRRYNKPDSFRTDLCIGKNLPKTKWMAEVACSTNLSGKISNQDVHWVDGWNDNQVFLFRESAQGEVRADRIMSFVKGLIERVGADAISSITLRRLNETGHLIDADSLYDQLSDLPFPVYLGFKLIGIYAPIQKYSNDQIMEFGKLMEKVSLPEDDPVKTHWYGHSTLRNSSFDESLEYHKLAVMRLDIDNLGKVFAFGMGENVPFALTATLSREFDLFFSGYMNHLARQYCLYTTYSGGDDAFVVGGWLNILHFAYRLREDFRRFAGHNPNLTLSAGIFLCDEHYPVAKFAARAEEAEKDAKGYHPSNYEPEGSEGETTKPVPVKDAVSVFGHTLPWEQYGNMLEISQYILACLPAGGENDEAKRFSRLLIHKIHRLIKASIDKKGRLLPQKMYRNGTQLKYLVARRSDDFKSEGLKTAPQDFADESIEAIIKGLISGFIHHFSPRDKAKPSNGFANPIKARILADLKVPTQYVLMKTRKEK